MIRNTEIDVPIDYLYVLSDIEKIVSQLTENGFSWEVKSPVECLFTLNSDQKEQLEEICQLNNICIYNCFEKISKTEAAYFSLFT